MLPSERPLAMNARLVVTPLFCCLSLIAQSFTLAAPVATSVLVQTAAGTMNNPVWPGPVAGSSTVGAQVGLFDRAEWQWNTFAGTTAAGFSASVRLNLGNPGVASVQPGQLLFTLTTPAGGAVHLEYTLVVQAPAGAAVPRVEIDIGADGTPDITQANVTPQTIGVPATGMPMPFLITIGAALAAPGAMTAEVRITARPSNGVSATRAYAGCSPLEFVRVMPTWSGGIEYQVIGNPMCPSIAVLGLQVQPTLLPVPGPPCLLFPSPDAIHFHSGVSSHTLAIPPGVRPIDFWVQGVTACGLESSWTYWVHAQ